MIISIFFFEQSTMAPSAAKMGELSAASLRVNVVGLWGFENFMGVAAEMDRIVTLALVALNLRVIGATRL